MNQNFFTRFRIKILKIKLGRRTLYDGNHGVDCGLALVGWSPIRTWRPLWRCLHCVKAYGLYDHGFVARWRLDFFADHYDTQGYILLLLIGFWFRGSFNRWYVFTLGWIWGKVLEAQLPGRLFSPSDICKKLSHHFLLHFPIAMGSYDHHAKYQDVFP